MCSCALTFRVIIAVLDNLSLRDGQFPLSSMFQYCKGSATTQGDWFWSSRSCDRKRWPISNLSTISEDVLESMTLAQLSHICLLQTSVYSLYRNGAAGAAQRRLPVCSHSCYHDWCFILSVLVTCLDISTAFDTSCYTPSSSRIQTIFYCTRLVIVFVTVHRQQYAKLGRHSD